MKKIILSLGAALIMYIAPAQVSKTITVATAGSFRSAFIAAGGNKTTVTNLTVTGNIDARDVKFMRDSMPVLAVLDIATAQIKAYNGAYGTYDMIATNYYPAGEMPSFSFCNAHHDVITDAYEFHGKNSLTSLKLSNSITSIGDFAFYACSGITGTLTIPSSVTSIGNSAFYGCSGLTGSLVIPTMVATIGNDAFESCTGLTDNLTLPHSLISIGGSAFSDCSGLTGSLKIPNSVKSIGYSAFEECSGLTGNLTIPNSVTSIGESAFIGCTGFKGSLTLSSSLTSIDIMAFYACTGLTGQLIIPNSINTINGDAFKGCEGFTSCYIPNTVASIGPTAFGVCSGMQKITINKVAPLLLYEFSNVDKTTCELIVPLGSKADYQAATGWKDFTHITEAYFVTLDTRGGNPAAPITTTLTNSTITEPDVPVRDGYSFVDWYKESACTNAWDFAMDIVTAPVTLYAKWTQNPVNITSREISNFKLYPNPATTTLNLGNLPQNAQISIFSIEGKLMKQQNITTSESTIDIEDFPKGVYLLKVNFKEISIQQKFIKQ